MTKEMKLTYSAIGVMAGSSMDGLDIVNVEFYKNDSNWSFTIIASATIPYPAQLFSKLAESAKESLSKKNKLDVIFGEWIAEKINHFILHHKLQVDLLAVHGHTVVHQPSKNISWQLGSGAIIADQTQLTTVTEFRGKDISLGGQGAPLVPVGDFMLFNEYQACLNLGGIANISTSETKKAWDVCPCNQVLNYFANQLGEDFDRNGELSRRGEIDFDFLRKLQLIPFFNEPPPKSLPNKFLKEQMLEKISPLVGLRTYTEFIAKQIAKDLSANTSEASSILVSGGGAHNQFLVECIKNYLPDWEVKIPTTTIIDFKEAIVFAFLGVLRLRNETNVLKSVTGASEDSSSGMIHFVK